MSWVALFRNLNLGQPKSPSGTELVAAFGGPALARTFQSNGTVVFESSDHERTTITALDELRAAGYSHHLTVRSLYDIRRAVAEVPARAPTEGIYRSMISFYDAAELPDVRLPLRSPNQLVELRSLHRTHAHSVCWKPGNTAGNVTAFLEQSLLIPVTTRTISTLERLLLAHVRGQRETTDES